VNEEGEKELITAPLDGTILAGVTRDSILQLTRKWAEFKVTERKYTLNEIIKAIKEKRLIEAFGSGTAAIVCPVRAIHWSGVDYDVPLDPTQPNSKAGPLTARLARSIMAIQYGEVASDWSWVLPSKSILSQDNK